MNTIYRHFILLAAVALSAGCVQEDFIEETSVDITARMEAEPDTRTSLSGLEGGMYYPLWSADDQIAVYVDNDADPSKFSLTSGEGSTVASFAGSRKGDDYIAVYPYDIAGSISDGTVSLTLPQTQKYTKASFGPGAFPMLATGSANDGLTFMNLCSVLKISLTGTAAVRSVTLTANDEDTFMSGPASAVTDYTASSENLLSMSAGGSRSVVLDTKGLEISETAPADVFIVVPSQTYKGGFTIEVDTYTETVTKKVSSDITFERSQIRAIRDFVLDSEVPELIPEAIPDDEIWYITSDGSTLVLNKAQEWWGYPETDFGAEVVSNTYVDGKGVIKFDAPLTKIGEYAFISNISLKEMYIPDSVKSIGSEAFYDCVELESLYLPDDLESVGRMAFWNCSKLTEFNTELASQDKKCLIVDSKIVGFAQYQIVEYTTPDGVESIADYAFANTQSLKKIIVSEGVKRIGKESFAANGGVPALEEVYLPSTLENLGVDAFIYQKNIKAFYGNNDFVSEDGYALLVDNYNGMGLKFMVSFASGSGLTSYAIPAGVEGLENYTFCQSETLSSVTFPEGLVYFGPETFYETFEIESISGPDVMNDNRSLVVDNTLLFVADKGLTEYIVPDCVTSLGYKVFSSKKYLEEVKMSDNITHVEGYGYLFLYSHNLKTVTVSARMKDLGYDPFGTSGYECSSLETIYMRAPIPPAITYNRTEGIPGSYENLTIYVPQDSYDAYMSSKSWSPFREYFEPYDYGDLSEFYPDYYISSDYSSDGGVETLQTATVGNGIDIVLMGDAYSDREIADGSYEADMEYMYDNLFTQEPFKTYKDLFNVYYVNVVSMTEGYENSGAALGGFFGDGTLVGGNDNKCFEYALNAVSEDRMDEALIIVAMNSDAYAGTCYMYYPESATGTYGSGPAVAYFPKGGDQTTFAQLLHHEANGHGFAKLADEYAYEDYGAVPDANVTQTRDQQNSWGWWKNVDFTSDPEQVRWSYFLEDERYANEGLGVFEGGLTYWTGVWRPTEDSIMRYNTGGFNAPSREAIYYRIHKLAYGDSWEYDYEEFVKYDAVNRSSSSAPQKTRRNYVERPLEPTAGPVVVGKSWRNANNDKN